MTLAPQHLAIVGMGACTPVGRDVWSSVAAARAGVCGFREHPFMIDSAGEPMRVAAAPWVDPSVQGTARLAALITPAVRQALEPVWSLLGTVIRRVALALALPPPRPGTAEDFPQKTRAAVGEVHARLAAGPTFACGHAAGYFALDAAVAAIAADAVDVCIVAGADSYLEPETLEWLDANEQLHGAGQLNNAWGFIPGEAGAALVLVPARTAARLGLQVFGFLASVGLGTETKLIKTDEVCIGEGLTTAFRSALTRAMADCRIDNVICDLNGETYRADEYGFTVLRTKEYFRNATDFVASADCWGDVGAAGGPLHIAQALIAAGKGYAGGPVSLTWGSSEVGGRGAAVVYAPLPGER